ncbi:hypothetical protein GCM10009551_097370 [Nocardiopsis tropica]|uniref:DNA/RNA non-specific endonuclease n=1 Tax=Tsukamurella strandjordii TaxID=147577 RepID=UPI0031DA4F4E
MVPDTPGQPAVDPSGSGTKLPSAVDAAPGQWDKFLGEDAEQYRKFFPSTVYPLSSTKTNHNGIENIAYQMSDGSVLNVTENYSGDAPLRRQSIENSPILGNVDINPSQGTATSTRTGAQIAVETLDNIDQALNLVPGPLKGARVITKGLEEGTRRGLNVPERTTVDATKAIPGRQSSAVNLRDVPESAVVKDGSHINPNGTLKPDTIYETGENGGYRYRTDKDGHIAQFDIKSLKSTTRSDRLNHDPNTPGKLEGDHAGHLVADRYGGSPKLDNIVSQLRSVNLSAYKKLENQWGRALDEGKDVSVRGRIINDLTGRPATFEIDYSIDGKWTHVEVDNVK